MAEKETVTESPTMEKPQQGNQVTGMDESEIGKLMDTLENYGVVNDKDLDNKLKASIQVGHLQNLLGDANQKINMLEGEVSKIKANRGNNPYQANNQSYYNDFSNPNPDAALSQMDQGVAMDFENMVGRAVEQAIGKREQMVQQRQARAYQSFDKAKKHPLFDQIKPIIDERVKDPEISLGLNRGELDYYDLYRDIVEEFQTNLLVQSRDTIKKLTGKGEGEGAATTMTNPPHIEAGGPAPVNPANLAGSGRETPEHPGITAMKKAREKVDKRGVDGGYLDEEEEIDLVHNFLGDLPL